MKKICTITFALMMLFVITACSNSANTSNKVTENIAKEKTSSVTTSINEKLPNSVPASESDSNSKSLVVYFSQPETTNPNNMTTDEENSVVVINGEVLGNTQYVAYVIKENTDADIFRIEPKIPYPVQHDELVDLASDEQRNNARPELLANVENITAYDTIFVGYPNWWGDMPMILYTFFDLNDFSGKTIIPFNTHGGSGFSNTISEIEALEPNANVIRNGFTVSRNNIQEAEQDIISWLDEVTDN